MREVILAGFLGALFECGFGLVAVSEGIGFCCLRYERHDE
jgi:hypothetical protein